MSNQVKMAIFGTLVIICIAASFYFYNLFKPKTYNKWEVNCSGLCYDVETKKPITGTVIGYRSDGTLSYKEVYKNGRRLNLKSYVYIQNEERIHDITYNPENGKETRYIYTINGKVISDCKTINGMKLCLQEDGTYRSKPTISAEFVTVP